MKKSKKPAHKKTKSKPKAPKLKKEVKRTIQKQTKVKKTVTKRKRVMKNALLYKCECGNSYLSYPGLFKHQKLKNHGIDSLRTQFIGGQPQTDDSQIKSKLETKDGRNLLQDEFETDYTEYLDLLLKAKQLKTATVQDLKIYRSSLLNNQDPSVSEFLNVYTTLVDKIVEFHKQHTDEDLRVSLEHYTSYQTVSLIEIYAMYLFYNYQWTSDVYLDELTVFLVLYRSFVQTQSTVKKRLPKAPRKSSKANQVQSYHADDIVSAANDFIIDYCYTQTNNNSVVNKNAELRYLGTDHENALNFIMMTKYFCKWLYCWEFTKKELTFIQGL